MAPGGSRKRKNDHQDNADNKKAQLTTPSTDVVTAKEAMGIDIQHTSKNISRADIQREDDEAIEEILHTLKRLVATVQDDLNVLPLETAISLLQCELENETHSEQARSILLHHLRRALLTRYSFFGHIQDLGNCFFHEEGTCLVVAKGTTGQDIEQVEGVQCAIQLIDECRQGIDIATFDDIIWIAEESIRLYTKGIRVLQQAELLTLLGNALIMKYLNGVGELDLTYAANKFCEAEYLCSGNVALGYISLAALAHIGWIRATECGDETGVMDAVGCMGKAQAIDKKGYELYRIGTKMAEGVVEMSQLQQLDEAIDHLMASLSCRVQPHPLRSSTLEGLSTALWTRFEWRGDFKDLEDSIAFNREGLRLGSRHHPDRAVWLNDLANTLAYRFQQKGAFQDLEDSILLYQEALGLRPSPHPLHHTSLSNLANVLSTRFKQKGGFKDLEDAILLHREALDLLPPSHPHRSGLLNNLANSLSSRFQQMGAFQDLDECILLHRGALDLLPPPHPDRSMSLNNLAAALSRRFEQKGALQDLEESIFLHREALDLQPPPHPGRSLSLNNLADALSTRFDQKGAFQDLEECILLHQEALDLQPPPHPHHSGSLNNLAAALSRRFEQKGALQDLEESIFLHREALHLFPSPHPDRSTSLNNLARSLSTRFDQKGAFQDLEECILLHREALDLRPPPHPDHSMSLNNLAAALSRRFEQKGAFQDLEECILLHREALDLRPPPHPDRSTSLNNLAASLSTRFDQKGAFQDLEECILLHREALDLLPPPHPDRSMSLNNLAAALSHCFEQKGSSQNFDQSILLLQEALDLHPAPHPDRSKTLNNLAVLHLTRYRQTNDNTDLEQALYSFESASRYETGSLLERLKITKYWAVSARAHRPSTALNAYLYVLELLPLLASIDLTLKQRSDVLEHSQGVVGDAAQWAISQNDLDNAVVVLSTGRSTFWSQTLQLRTAVDEVAAIDPNLAQRYRDISKALEQASYIPEQRYNMNPASDVQVTRQIGISSLSNLASERGQVIDEIRRLPGFENFLLPPSFPSLQLAAHRGPIVFLSASRFGCDALIMQDVNPVEHVPLPNIEKSYLQALNIFLHKTLHGELMSMENSQPESRNVITDLEEFMLRDVHKDTEGDSITCDDILQFVLKALWEKAIYPVVMALGLQKTDSPTRIWWCPSGAFASLPIHAAGLYSDDKKPIDCLIQYAVSSYITSPQDLLHPLPQISPDCKITAIIEPEASGGEPLPAAKQELLCIKAHVPDPNQLISRVGTKNTRNKVEDVISDIQQSSIVHFGCHGAQNLDDPLESALLLSGGRLTMSKLIEDCRTSNTAALAYLSACETAKGDKDRPDESLNLVATMMFAGFRSVVGTMWSIFDYDAPIVADVFYGHLFRNGKAKPPDVRDAAYSLHLATAELRKQGRGFQSWVPFVHYGI